jgi:hypothetical protein
MVFKKSDASMPSVKQLKQAGFHLSAAVGTETTDFPETKEKASCCKYAAGGQNTSD